MNYEISRALKVGKQLTTAQRTSSLFASEPVVLGKVLRRGSRPIIVDEERFKQNEAKLRALEKAGSIMIKVLPSADQVSEEPKKEEPQDLLDEVIAERTAKNPEFPQMVEAASEVKTEDEVPPITDEATVTLKDIASEKPKKNKKQSKE